MTIRVIHEPEFVGPETFKSIAIGEVFEFEGHYYKKLPYELSRDPDKKGLAIGLTDEGVYYFNDDDIALACDVKCSISYVYAREEDVLKGMPDGT